MQVPGARVTWACTLQYQNAEEAKRHMFNCSGWGSESIVPMLNEFREKPCPYGGILGDLFDATPQDTISKVYLEHKMFDTWFYKRSVLIGDGKLKTFKKKNLSIGSLLSLLFVVIFVICCRILRLTATNSFGPFLDSFAFSLACHKVKSALQIGILQI